MEYQIPLVVVTRTKEKGQKKFYCDKLNIRK